MGGRVNGFDCGVEANEQEVRVGCVNPVMNAADTRS